MLPSFVAGQDRVHKRLLSGCLLLIALWVSFPVAAQQEQEDRPLSPSVVLVLKLVSKTHVQPTTGIVVSDDGLVLVPASLVNEPGEIVVLDNGVDIAVNGRPAAIVDKPHSGGLALISVEGLKRPAITLSANALETDQSLHLETFPPPKLMAKGAKPLWVPVKIALSDSNMRAAVSAETPLPFITGPIIDDCGYFAGLSLALGPSSMELDKLPIVAFTDELIQIFDAMQVSLRTARCETIAVSEYAPETVSSSTPEVDNTAGIPEPEPMAEETQAAVEESPVSGTIPDRPVSTVVNERPSIWSHVPLWVVLVGVIILGALVWKGIFLLRLTKSPQQQTSTPPIVQNPVASDEPDTAQLDVKTGASDLRPRSAPLLESTIPDMSALPPGCNAVVMIEGFFDANTTFRRYCAVDSKHIDIIFGRGDVDISIEHPAISRAHARLLGNTESMTFSDLGSSNGVFINGIPCLPGEIMFVETGDEVFLGQLKIRIAVASTQAELT
jgi:hypothetical protein